MLPLVPLLLLLALSLAKAEEADKKIRQISKFEYAIDQIRLDQKKQEISFPATVNMTEGLLEYLVVGIQSDKVHESLFVSESSPLNLNIALKLLGIQESKEIFPLLDQDFRPTGKFPKVEEETRKQSRIDLFVEWTSEGKTTRVPANELIHHITWKTDDHDVQPSQDVPLDKAQLTPMEAGPWLSSGSYLVDGKFKADLNGLHAAIYTVEGALINYLGKDRLKGDVWIPHQELPLKKGELVSIIIKPHQS